MRQKRRDFLRIMGLSTLAFYFPTCKDKAKEEVKAERPNIILIMADDMGFSDLECYGSEISTPNINNLARRGLRFSNFYNAARCCPTRASLLTGLYPHQTGLGAMVSSDPANAEPGPYQGFLNNNCVTLAEVLKSAGYNTFMSGKWHVGEEHPQWPMDRGFDDYYGLISGGANYFDIRKTKAPGVKRHFAKGNEEYMPPTENWYITDAITDNAVRMLDEFSKKENPFFLYLSYTAPHWPLHAWPEDIAKYRNEYKKGWDSKRIERYVRQHQLNLFGKGVRISPRDPIAPDWDSLSKEKKEEMELKMAVYAAQIDCMDRGIGKVIAKLNELEKFENTLIMFLSDNGGCAEGGVFGQDFWKNGVPPGGKDGFHSYGLAWANYSNTPFRKYKQYTHEGGISTPFIACWPAVIIEKGIITHQPAHIMDIMPTCCEISGATYPENYKGHKILPVEGKSLKRIFEGYIRPPHEILCWEHIGSVGIRKGNWKLVAARHEKWELYDLDKDRTELENLIEKNPEKAKELHEDWMDWAKRCGAKISDIHKQIK
jgi:arylsulfatase A-like enzyme